MEFITVEEAAELARSSPRTIRKLCGERRFPAANIGTKKRHVWRIEREGFIRYLKGEKR